LPSFPLLCEKLKHGRKRKLNRLQKEREVMKIDEDPYPNPHLKKGKPRKRSEESREEKVGLGFLKFCDPKFEAF